MISPQAEAAGLTDLVPPSPADLEARYQAYRLRQARSLVGLMPREAVRPLYRKALARRPRDADVDPNDPLSLLVSYCARLLPLPPFEAWVDDVARNPEAYLDDLDDSAGTPTPAAPATIVSRRFGRGTESWVAQLRGFRDRDAWRGFIAFRGDAAGGTHRTALIFRESNPSALRARFLEFDRAALHAFLRSALP